jgi:hypothetical protein
MFELFPLLNIDSRMIEISRMKKEATRLMQKGNLKEYFSKLVEVERLEKQVKSFQFN